jgi:hypothetical protein
MNFHTQVDMTHNTTPFLRITGTNTRLDQKTLAHQFIIQTPPDNSHSPYRNQFDRNLPSSRLKQLRLQRLYQGQLGREQKISPSKINKLKNYAVNKIHLQPVTKISAIA